MAGKRDIELKVAEFLLQIKAIKLQPAKPFTWASGWKSPVYCDNRLSLSHPAIRTFIRQHLSALIQDEFGGVDCIAGVATAGIPQGVLVAQELGLPFVYVRNKAKEHGTGRLIEGIISEGQRVMVIEDLISTGKSSLAAIDVLRDAGCFVIGLVAIFDYGFNIAAERFKEAKVPYSSLSNYNALIEYASTHSVIAAADVDMLNEWSKDPENWKGENDGTV